MPAPWTVSTADGTAPPASGAVVVGYTGSRSGEAALEWGELDAALQHRRLHVIHTDEPRARLGAGSGPAGGTAAEAARRVRARSPQLDVTQAEVRGPAAQVLLEAASSADTVVLGAHGHRLLRLSDLGSTAWQVVSHAPCPVVVVRAGPSA